MSSTGNRSQVNDCPAKRLWLAYDSFILALQAARRAPRTIEYYREKLRPFVVWLEAHAVTDVTGIQADHIRAFLLEREKAGRSALTVHHHAACIKAFCNFLVSDDLLPDSPMRKVKMPKVEDRILPAFSVDDVRKLLAATDDPRDTAIILALLDTGLRASEFCALNVGDVDLKTGAVQVQLGKNKKGRVVYLGAHARRALIRYLLARDEAAPDAPLWVRKSAVHEYTDDRLTRSTLRHVLEAVNEKAQVAHCHPHTFRRTFALECLRAGMSIYALQRLMGHADLNILRKYLALVEHDLAEAHRQHGAVDTMLTKKGR